MQMTTRTQTTDSAVAALTASSAFAVGAAFAPSSAPSSDTFDCAVPAPAAELGPPGLVAAAAAAG